MDTLDTKKYESMDVQSMLRTIIERLDRIESLIEKKNRFITPRMNIDDSDSESDNDCAANVAEDSDYGSDSDEPITMEPSYDSDHDRPVYTPREYPQTKLSLTPLQIQLASEEFMQYKNRAEDQTIE